MSNYIVNVIFILFLLLVLFKIYLIKISERIFHKYDNYSYQRKKKIILNNYNHLIKSSNKIKLLKNGDVHVYRIRENIKQKLDLTFLKKVIHLDIKNKIIYVEGLIRFDDLINYTLNYNLLPYVVPELRSLTVGGVISGLGIESSSFKYGLFHHSAIEYEILTGNGDIIIANKKQNVELFNSFPNTYGSIGYILSAKLKLMTVKKYVKTENLIFNNVKEFLYEINKIMNYKKSIDFLDGIILNKTKFILIKGTMVSNPPSKLNKYVEKIYVNSVDKLTTDYMTIKDYIWRYDSNYFFLGANSNTFIQNIFVRKYLGNLLRSDKLFKISNNILTNTLLSKTTENIGNDIAVNTTNFIEFFDWYNKTINVYPIWICPYSCSNKSDVFFKCDHDFEIDFGIGFGVSKNNQYQKDKNYYKKIIDAKLYDMKIKKGLYCTTFLSNKQLYELYDPSDKYPKLKKKYDTKNKLFSLSDKILKNK